MIGTTMLWLALAGIYLALLGSAHAGDLLVGLLVSAAILYALGLKGLCSAGNVASLARLSLGLLREFGAGSAAMVRALWSGRSGAGEIITLPLPLNGERAALWTAFVLTAIPGILVLELDMPARRLSVHALDVAQPARVQGRLQRFHDRCQRTEAR